MEGVRQLSMMSRGINEGLLLIAGYTFNHCTSKAKMSALQMIRYWFLLFFDLHHL